MLTTLGTVIIFRLWTIRNEAPKYAMISIRGTLNDYIGMGMRSLINFNDYLKESLALQRCRFKLSYKYPTIIGICNEFKCLMRKFIFNFILKKSDGNHNGRWKKMQ